jgi:hypothetical protein
MTTPTDSEYLNAANWTYSANSPYNPPGVTPPPPADLRPFLVDGKQLTALDDSTGFYGAAFLTPSNQVIIAFEGTTPYEAPAIAQFADAEAAADGAIFAGLNPPVYRSALAFTQQVEQDAARQNIGAGDIFITGHSLGAGEAEYVGSQTGLGGATFAGPGIASADIGAHDGSNLVDYIERGDPIANYANDSNDEGNFQINHSVEHYGRTQYLGSFENSVPLSYVGANLGLGTAATLSAVGVLTVTFDVFHPAPTYADSLGITLSNEDPKDDFGSLLLSLENLLGVPAGQTEQFFHSVMQNGTGNIGTAFTYLSALTSLGTNAGVLTEYLQQQGSPAPAAPPASTPAAPPGMLPAMTDRSVGAVIASLAHMQAS